MSQKAVHLASTCRGGVIQEEGSRRRRGKEASQPHTVGRAEARSEGGSDVETWAACRRSRRGPGGGVDGRGEAKGEKVSRVCAHGAVREGWAPQRAAVKAYTGGGGRWCSGCAGGGSSGRGIGDGAPGRRVGQPRHGVQWAGEAGGEEGRPGQGWDVGSAGGGESVRQGESVVSAGTGEHGAADCPA